MKIDLLWNKSDKIALALSGGIDSIVLFHLLISTYKNTYKELVIFHINHGLRKESDIEEKFIQKLAENHNIKLYTKKLFLKNKDKKKHISEEMLARKLRYASFRKMADEENIDILITAHHKNDNIENILMRILSGRGITSELEIESKTEINNLKIARPLLNILKEDILKYAKNNQIKYYDDITNYDVENYTRNYIRHEIVPKIKKISGSYDNLIKFADNYKKIKITAEKQAKLSINNIKLKISEDKVTFAFYDFLNLDNLEKVYLLSNIIKENFKSIEVTRKSLQKAVENINELSGNISIDLKQNLKIIKEYQSISICKIEKKCYNDKIEIKIDDLKEDFYCNFKGNNIIITKENKLSEIGINKNDFPILITSRQNGDKIKRGSIYKKLSRLFIDEKIPKTIRDQIPVIRNKKGEIIGILGIESKNIKKNYDYYVKILKG